MILLCILYYFEATYNEARDIEIQAVDISTNDEDALQTALANKVTNNKSLSVKRAISKPRRLCSSDEEHQKLCKFKSFDLFTNLQINRNFIF